MRIRLVTATGVILVLLAVNTVRGEDAGFAWRTDQSPQGVRQTGAVVGQLPDVSRGALSAQASTMSSALDASRFASRPVESAETTSRAPIRVAGLRRDSVWGGPEAAAEAPPAVPAGDDVRPVRKPAEKAPAKEKEIVPVPLPAATAASPMGGEVILGCDRCGLETCDGSCRRPSDCDEAARLFSPTCLESRGIFTRGWIDQGFTWNPDMPANRFNGPVSMNDRANEYQMNQLYLFSERLTDTGGCGTDWGGRVDLLYGTDWRWVRTGGLEDRWNESSRFYGLAMPQLYADFAMDDFIFRLGHFYSGMGYERATAPDNFFYSRSYSFQYGAPISFTGLEIFWKLSDRVTVEGGINRGWNQWEDNNDKMGFTGRAVWKSEDENTSVGFGVVTGNELVGVSSTRTLVNVVLEHRLNDRLRYALEYNGGRETNGVVGRVGRSDAEWYSFANYLFLDLNPCWTVGGRYEWFSDYDGLRIANDFAPHTISMQGIPAYWNELALGVNYKPNRAVTLRSEVRWDWIANVADGTRMPFDDASTKQQFLWGTDLIVRF